LIAAAELGKRAYRDGEVHFLEALRLRPAKRLLFGAAENDTSAARA
jgi:hypothetical protein